MITGFFFLMIRRPPRSTPLYSSAASDVYKRQHVNSIYFNEIDGVDMSLSQLPHVHLLFTCLLYTSPSPRASQDLVCRLLLEKKKLLFLLHTISYSPTPVINTSHTAYTSSPHTSSYPSPKNYNLLHTTCNS